jgi:hypothetical protein
MYMWDCAHIHVHVRLCTHPCTCETVHTSMYMWDCAHIHVHVRLCTHPCTYIHGRLWTHEHTCFWENTTYVSPDDIIKHATPQLGSRVVTSTVESPYPTLHGQQCVRLQRLWDYQVVFSVVYYGDCAQEDGHIREMLDYWGVGLQRFNCTYTCMDIRTLR